VAAWSGAVEHACIPRARGGELKATWPRIPFGARAASGVVEACIVVIDARNRVTGPGRTLRVTENTGQEWG